MVVCRYIHLSSSLYRVLLWTSGSECTWSHTDPSTLLEVLQSFGNHFPGLPQTFNVLFCDSNWVNSPTHVVCRSPVSHLVYSKPSGGPVTLVYTLDRSSPSTDRRGPRGGSLCRVFYVFIVYHSFSDYRFSVYLNGRSVFGHYWFAEKELESWCTFEVFPN